MSRAIIGGAVALAIAVLTATAYFVTTARLEDRVERDVRVRVAKAQELLIQNASLEGLGLLKRVEVLARDQDLVHALSAKDPEQTSELATLAFRRFRQGLSARDPKPDILALTDKQGHVVALLDVVRPLPNQWMENGHIKYAALKLALDKRQVTSDVLNFDNKGLMKVGMAPVVDPALDQVEGAVVVAYSVSVDEAARQHDLLGANVAYFYGQRVHATSLRGKDAANASALAKPLFKQGLAKSALKNGLANVVKVHIGGDTFLATAGRLPRFSNHPLPKDYPPHGAGAMVMMSLTAAMAPLGSVKLAILLLGAGALIVALLAIALTAKTFLVPIDEIEVGINEIINGNVDRTFRPVGSDLDGLSNGLNVMLARLLGRPEPGEEQFDEDGNIVAAGGFSFDTAEISARDAEALALANEPDADYYKRVYSEFVEARKAAGESVSGLTYESFVAKLRLSEANLRKKYSSRAVRFKVVTKDGKVTLKPVPIA